MNYTIIAYNIYLILVVALIIWVANTIYNNSKILLFDICHQQDQLATSINKFIQAGFYLFGLGFAIVRLRMAQQWEYDNRTQLVINKGEAIMSYQSMIEALSSKIGGFILILGLMLFINFFLLLLIRGGAKNKNNSQTKVVIKGI